MTVNVSRNRRFNFVKYEFDEWMSGFCGHECLSEYTAASVVMT